MATPKKEWKAKILFFWQPTKGWRRSVELEKLQQLVVPGGQPTIEPKRARTHTNTNTARIRIRCCNLATWVSQEKCGWNILVTFFSVVLVWNTFKGDFLGRLKKCLLETLTSFCNLENSWILQGIFNSHSYAIPVHDCHHLSCYYLWHYFYLLSFKDANNLQLCLFNATNEYFTNMCIFLFNCLIHTFRCDSFGFIFH